MWGNAGKTRSEKVNDEGRRKEGGETRPLSDNAATASSRAVVWVSLFIAIHAGSTGCTGLLHTGAARLLLLQEGELGSP